MKKLFCVLLIILTCFAAFSEDRIVVGCDEWVSLREKPDSTSVRLTKVPLDALVTNCVDHNKEYTYCEYEGLHGFILTKYLQPAGSFSEDVIQRDDTVICITTESTQALCHTLTCYGEDGVSLLWTRSFLAEAGGQYDAFCTFPDFDFSHVYVHCAGEGLYCLNYDTGLVEWFLPAWKTSLGSGISYTFDASGNLYVCGADTPSAPVCINPRGETVWKSSLGDWGHEVFWPYELYAGEEGLYVKYDSYQMTEADGCYLALFGYDGSLISVTACSQIPEFE